MATTGPHTGSQQNMGQNPSSPRTNPASTYPERDIPRQVQELGTSVAEKAKETATGVGERVREAAASAASSVGEMATNVGERAEQTVSGVGEQMRTLAGTIRQKAPHEGFIGSAASTVADSLEAGGRYLEEENLSGVAQDAANLIRRYPLQAVLIGFGIGFLVARATRS